MHSIDRMVIADIFFVKSPSSSNPPTSINELRQRMDRRAPAPWLGVCPRGEPVAIFAVDFRQSPAAMCARLGFDYTHAGFVDVRAEIYRQDYEMRFDSDPLLWVKIFMAAWIRQENERNFRTRST